MGVEIDHHESDLYVPVTKETQAFLAQFPEMSVTMFTSLIDNKLWFDIPFMYEPFWPKKGQQSCNS